VNVTGQAQGAADESQKKELLFLKKKKQKDFGIWGRVRWECR